MDERFDLLRWLGREGEHQRLLEILPADTITRNADIFLIYVDALAAAGRWKELLALMQASKPPVTASTARLILAQCNAMLKTDPNEVRSDLADLLDKNARSDAQLLLRTASLAESLHFYDLAVRGLTLVVQMRTALRLNLLEKINDLQQSDRDIQGLLGTAKQLCELRPNNPVYASRLNYLRLVSGQEVEVACNEVLSASALAEAPGNAVPAPLLRALAAWRWRDLERMKRETDAIPDPSRLRAGYRAVTAGLYSLSGRDTEGFRLAEKVPAGLLLDGERWFLNRSLR